MHRYTSQWPSDQERDVFLEGSMKETVFRVIERDTEWRWSLPPTIGSDPRQLLRELSGSALKTLRFSGNTWGRHFITTTVLSRLETDELHIANTLVNLLGSDDVTGTLMKVGGHAAADLSNTRAADAFWETVGLSVDDCRSQLSKVDSWIDDIFGAFVYAILRDYPYSSNQLGEGAFSSNRAHIVTPLIAPQHRQYNNKRPLDSQAPERREVRPRIAELAQPDASSVAAFTSPPNSPLLSPELPSSEVQPMPAASATSPVWLPSRPQWAPAETQVMARALIISYNEN